MKDPEFIELRNKFFIAALIIGIFATTLIVFIFKLNGSSSLIYNDVKQKKDVLVLVVDKDCDKCNAVGEVLKDNNIKFKKMDRYKDNKTKLIYQKIGLDDKIITPCILNIKKGKLDSYFDNIDNKIELEEYLSSIE